MIFNGLNFGKISVAPKSKMNPGEQFGSMHVLREELTISQAYANGDIILGPSLPANARVHDAQIKVDGSLGASGILDLGHAASEDGSVAASQAAFVTNADAGGAAVLKKPIVANEGIDKSFSEKVQTQLQFTEASTAIAGVKISYAIFYTIN